MGRYNEQKSAKQVSIWKIIFGVAFGIVLAGMLTTFGFIFFTGAAIWGFNETIKNQSAQANQFNNLRALATVPISTAPPQQNNQLESVASGHQESIIPLPLFQIPKTREMLIKEKSQHAYMEVRKELNDFKSQYKKPDECYNMKDNATRMHCANAFIKAREAYEALNK